MQNPGRPASLENRSLRQSGLIYLTGIQALVRLPVRSCRADRRAGAVTAGFISGYEGSPLAGYDLELNRRIDELSAHDIVFTPAVNEELAATAVQGTQLACASPRARVAGVTGWWYGKSPGLDRAADSIRHNNLMGTHPQGGAIAIVGDDPAAKSSTVPGHPINSWPIWVCPLSIRLTCKTCWTSACTQWPCLGAAGCGPH